MNDGLSTKRLLLAGAIVDAVGGVTRPGAILLQGTQIVVAGSPEAIGRIDDVERVVLRDRLVLPALVNAHAHLDLTHMGPQPAGGSFVDWVQRVRAGRAQSPETIADSVRQGVELSRQGGTGLIGDIAGAGSFVPLAALREEGLPGVSFLEVFGIGRTAHDAITHLDRACEELDHCANGVALGVQPHAPYSCARAVYDHAAKLDLPLSTHLAETQEELQLCRQGVGPLAEMLRGIGVWNETVEIPFAHPIEALEGALSARPWLAAHCNYIDQRHIEMLAQWGTTVVYCPRASAYFGHPQPHSYCAMLDAGVRVAIGTDSILCLDTADRISPLDELRFLYRRDGGDPVTLLHMATTAGAEALGRSHSSVTLKPGETLGLIGLPIDPDDATDPLIQALLSDAAPEWIMMSTEE